MRPPKTIVITDFGRCVWGLGGNGADSGQGRCSDDGYIELGRFDAEVAETLDQMKKWEIRLMA